MSAQVSAIALPPNSALRSYVKPGDFLDCYAVASDKPPREAALVITAFPGWVELLMRLRGVLTAPFGLVNEVAADVDAIGLFPVESATDTELIAGFDDKHLNFRISIMSDGGAVALATWVHPHNLGGKFYLAAIMPFHELIIRDALRRLAAVS